MRCAMAIAIVIAQLGWPTCCASAFAWDPSGFVFWCLSVAYVVARKCYKRPACGRARGSMTVAHLGGCAWCSALVLGRFWEACIVVVGWGGGRLPSWAACAWPFGGCTAQRRMWRLLGLIRQPLVWLLVFEAGVSC